MSEQADETIRELGRISADNFLRSLVRLESELRIALALSNHLGIDYVTMQLSTALLAVSRSTHILNATKPTNGADNENQVNTED